MRSIRPWTVLEGVREIIVEKSDRFRGGWWENQGSARAETEDTVTYILRGADT